jgi:hypothetical protein
MITAIQMKWALLVLIVGPGGGSMSKVAMFDSEQACRIAQKNVVDWATAITESARSSNLQVNYSLNFQCVEMPAASGTGELVVPIEPINPGGGGK